MKLLEICVEGKMSSEEGGFSPKIGDVDLWRAAQFITAISEGRNVRLTVAMEEIEESPDSPAVKVYPENEEE